MSTPIQAVIFDMDGLMVDNEGQQSASYEEVLHQLGVKPEFNAMGIVHTVGIVALENCKRLIAKYGLNISPEDLNARKQAAYSQLLEAGVSPMPGLAQLVNTLKTNKVKLAIASSSTRHDIDLTLKHLGLAGYFDVIVSGEEVANSKPAPDIFVAAASGLRVTPDKTVAIEDAGRGVEAAKAAGMKVIAVPNTYTKGQDFDSADLIVNSLEELNWDKISRLLDD